MRLLRYKTKESEFPFGIYENGHVFQLIGNPLTRFSQGERIGSLEDIELVAPCKPSKVVAMAINFKGIDNYSPDMSEPMVFVKPGSCICDPFSVVSNPFPNLPMWGESELAVVIKNQIANCNEDEVKEKVLGFTIANDVTVENIDGRDHHLARSKCPDSFCPLGPWIDTEFDASDCLIQAVQNNEVIREGRSSEQIWQWPKILSWLSTWITLEPWDVVLTGNPPDTVGMRYVNDGDCYTARIESLGELTCYFSIKKIT